MSLIVQDDGNAVLVLLHIETFHSGVMHNVVSTWKSNMLPRAAISPRHAAKGPHLPSLWLSQASEFGSFESAFSTTT